MCGVRRHRENRRVALPPQSGGIGPEFECLSLRPGLPRPFGQVLPSRTSSSMEGRSARTAVVRSSSITLRLAAAILASTIALLLWLAGRMEKAPEQQGSPIGPPRTRGSMNGRPGGLSCCCPGRSPSSARSQSGGAPGRLWPNRRPAFLRPPTKPVREESVDTMRPEVVRELLSLRRHLWGRLGPLPQLGLEIENAVVRRGVRGLRVTLNSAAHRARALPARPPSKEESESRPAASGASALFLFLAHELRCDRAQEREKRR